MNFGERRSRVDWKGSRDGLVKKKRVTGLSLTEGDTLLRGAVGYSQRGSEENEPMTSSGPLGSVASRPERHREDSCSMLDEVSRIITRSPGESVLLPCPCPSTGHVKPERVTWSYSKAGSSDRTPVSNDTGSYRGRVRTFDQTGSRNLSLLISDLTKEDAGQYTCKSDQHSIYVELKVKGCALVENKQTATVSRSSGESVLLSCTCTDPPEDTPVTVQWRGPHQEDLLQRSRVQTFTKTSPGNLSVLISDLTVKDTGTYSCWINQNQYRNFTLTVKGKLLDSLTFTHMPYETVMKLEWIIRV
ncbi:hypothetical protein NFI96_008661 [Prochilodus magdalenae]|nr:hypothetical protein NFI96_008661 [Prochilodus magdalenae]